MIDKLIELLKRQGEWTVNYDSLYTGEPFIHSIVHSSGITLQIGLCNVWRIIYFKKYTLGFWEKYKLKKALKPYFQNLPSPKNKIEEVLNEALKKS